MKKKGSHRYAFKRYGVWEHKFATNYAFYFSFTLFCLKVEIIDNFCKFTLETAQLTKQYIEQGNNHKNYLDTWFNLIKAKINELYDKN